MHDHEGSSEDEQQNRYERHAWSPAGRSQNQGGVSRLDQELNDSSLRLSVGLDPTLETSCQDIIAFCEPESVP